MVIGKSGANVALCRQMPGGALMSARTFAGNLLAPVAVSGRS